MYSYECHSKEKKVRSLTKV